ncbi:MAG TPA: hypothetical protein VHP33_34850 [Polyangiaceae bacterium]|nr:hypothetical protein [Polyangiaceae bacterium]
MSYDDAVRTLYQALLSDFVAERKRLSAELKVTGDKETAARFAKLARPPVSAWAVNQLWWREREAFDALLEAAKRVKVGDRDAAQAHRQALAKLRDAAARLLQESGNAASDGTLRRVATTLSALAAAGGFAPDPPGALSADRDPPGFEALGFGAPAAATAAAARSPEAPAESAESPQTAERRRAEEAEKRRAEEAEKRRAEEAERQRRLAERERLSALLRDAEQLTDSQRRDVARLRGELETAEQSLKKTQALLADLEQQLASL